MLHERCSVAQQQAQAAEVLDGQNVPPVTVRTQVTVDRTRCLYDPNELPERITETLPISYYNAMDD